MQTKLLVLLTLTLGLTQFSTNAATVSVEWKNTDKYSDIRSGEQNRAYFKRYVFSSLEKHLAKLAEKLPEKQKLSIEVTNLDLAGDIEFSSARQMRIVRDIYIPRISLSYKLVDENNQAIKNDNIKLKDMSFMMTSKLRYRNESFGYEKKMLDDWFNDTFLTSKK
jgi:hypothetical protein